MASIAPAALGERLRRGEALVVIDVRSPAEFARSHVPGAINVPYADAGRLASGIPAGPDDEVVLYCGHGPRAWLAAATLRRHGFRRITYLGGHWAAWQREGLPVEAEPGG
jgi:rhodanese-related sulfurtransferase